MKCRVSVRGQGSGAPEGGGSGGIGGTAQGAQGIRGPRVAHFVFSCKLQVASCIFENGKGERELISTVYPKQNG